jgi:hypothetical protein
MLCGVRIQACRIDICVDVSFQAPEHRRSRKQHRPQSASGCQPAPQLAARPLVSATGRSWAVRKAVTLRSTIGTKSKLRNEPTETAYLNTLLLIGGYARKRQGGFHESRKVRKGKEINQGQGTNKADCQSAAGCQPALQRSRVFIATGVDVARGKRTTLALEFLPRSIETPPRR